jgi:uncharacterized damage-inducible protein DinB
MTDRELLIAMWTEMWDKYTWIPGWGKAFADLTPQQAAWKPSPHRNSIWQILNHIAFWREVTVDRLAGKKDPAEDVMTKRNFEEPSDVSASAWQAAQERLRRSHEAMLTALNDPKAPVEKLRYLLPHDAYHLGQIMYLRALQGLPAISFA